ncbi:MAG: hypothetical protein KatS3mg011_2103 [Acidimicrobiia bacterium]|nr:MAG: hypothetical protein KatS3mg011_2103 [Acidimicrobiia bacterium]
MDPDVGAANAFRFASIEDRWTAVDDHTGQDHLEPAHPEPAGQIVGGFKGMAIVPREIVEAGI